MAKSQEEQIQQTMQYLDELLSFMRMQNTELSGGIETPLTNEIIKSLKETRISFGNPRHMLSKVRLEDLQRFDIPEHDPLYRQAEEEYDFYYMSLNSSFAAQREVRFQQVLCRLELEPDDAMIHSLAPEQAWQAVAEWGGEGHIGLGTNLAMKFAAPEMMQNLPVAVKEISAQARASAFFSILPFKFDLGRVTVVGIGIGSNKAQWDIGKPRIQKQNEVTFALLFKVSQGTKRIQLTGHILVKLDKNYLIEALQSLWAILTADLRRPLEHEEELILGTSEMWTLDLPQ